MAAAAGTTVTGVVTIDEQGAAQPAYRSYAGDTAYPAAMAGLSAQVVPPDQIQTQVTVIVTWAIG
jgi:uncharacterized protein YggE